MNNNWFKVSRDLYTSDLWLSEPFTRGQAWVDLIGLANFKDGFIRVRGIRVDLGRGQVGWSKERLCKRWKWSKGKLNRWFNELEIDRQIAQHISRTMSVITIMNYDKYQNNEPTDGLPIDRQTDYRQSAKKKEKKEKKENNDNNYGFNEFWTKYPNKKSKANALKVWERLNPNPELVEKILTALDWQKNSEDWVKDGGKFIPHPTSWLNGRRWEDERPVVAERKVYKSLNC